MMTPFICNEFYRRGRAKRVVNTFLKPFKCKKKDKCQGVFAKSANILGFISDVFVLASTIQLIPNFFCKQNESISKREKCANTFTKPPKVW